MFGPNLSILKSAHPLQQNPKTHFMHGPMAITTLISSTPTHYPLSPPWTLPSPSSSTKSNISLVSNEALKIIESAAGAVELARTAVYAAREAVALASEVEDVDYWFSEESGDLLLEERRKRQRKKKMERYGIIEKGIGEEDENLLVKIKLKCRNLSRIEEAEICQCLKEGARLEEARRSIAEAQEQESISNQLAKAVRMKRRKVDKIICKERESQERIIRSYRRLVVSIATGYQGKGLSLHDLIQEGSIGLLHGAKKFDPERGYKLSTYVYWWIKQAIIRAVANKSRIIRLPGGMSQMVANITEANNVLSRRLRRLPTYNEISENLHIPISSVRIALERNRHAISLDQVVTDQGCMTLQDITAGPDETMPEKMVEKRLMKQELEKLLDTLTEREARILKLLFGLNGETPKSCEEVGTIVKLSRERVRQLKGIALTKLRQINSMETLKVYIM